MTPEEWAAKARYAICLQWPSVSVMFAGSERIVDRTIATIIHNATAALESEADRLTSENLSLRKELDDTQRAAQQAEEHRDGIEADLRKERDELKRQLIATELRETRRVAELSDSDPVGLVVPPALMDAPTFGWTVAGYEARQLLREWQKTPDSMDGPVPHLNPVAAIDKLADITRQCIADGTYRYSDPADFEE